MTYRPITKAEMEAAPPWAGYDLILARPTRRDAQEGAFYAKPAPNGHRSVHATNGARTSEPYSLADDATVRRMAAAGASARTVGEAVGRSESSVRVYACKNRIVFRGGHAGRCWTPDEDDTLRRMAGKATAREIADATGWPEGSVRSRIGKLKLSLKRRA